MKNFKLKMFIGSKLQ